MKKKQRGIDDSRGTRTYSNKQITSEVLGSYSKKRMIIIMIGNLRGRIDFLVVFFVWLLKKWVVKETTSKSYGWTPCGVRVWEIGTIITSTATAYCS